MKKIKELGKGGFGIVDLVEDDDGDLYARKTFAENQPLTPEMLENVIKRFKKEARFQKSISHPNIVPVIYDDPDSDPPYYLMPVAESSLDKDIAADRTLGGNFIAVISDIVSALEELHSVRIYHRDLKPQNVLRFLDTSGEQPVTYYAVSDFGLISLVESQLTALTTTGMAKGSDYYTAPEITKDLHKASAQSDIYSLGCILHDIVGADDRIVCGEIKEDGPYGGILRGCTRSDPDRRFRSVKSVLDALISVGSADVATESPQAADFIFDLSSDKSMPAKFWMALSDFLDSTASKQDRNAICLNLSGERISKLCDLAPGCANQIGSVFAEWVFHTAFNFDHCDGIASRLEIFIESCDFDTKIDCLIAMLQMGTTHNRWYVERKFVRLCTADMDRALAKRLAIEFRVRDDWICEAVDRLERSINFDRNQLHPEVVHALVELCL